MLVFLSGLYKSKGLLLGIKSKFVYSCVPSTLLCNVKNGSSGDQNMVLQKAKYSSFVISEGFLTHKGLLSLTLELSTPSSCSKNIPKEIWLA